MTNGLRFTLTLAEPVPCHIEEDVLKVGRSLHPLTLESLVEQPLDESVGRLHRQDLAVVHDRDPVAEGLSLVHVVGGENNRPPLGTDWLRQLPEVPACLRIEATRRLAAEP